MGKTARWLKGFLSGKKEASSAPDSKPVKEKKKKKKGWSFVRSLKDKTTTTTPNVVDRKRGFHSEQLSYNAGGVEDQNHHAIAVAAATAAAAEAAVAAAQAAAAVVRLTSNSGRCNSTNRSVGKREQWEWAAVKIQAAFRGYLARRALRALKGLVRLQALVRGHIVRKGMVENLRCLQALVRAQARARAGRIHISESQYSYSKQLLSHNPGPATPEKLEQPICASSARYDRSPSLKRNNSRSNIRHGNNVDRKQSAKNRFDHWMDECIRDRFRETSVKATDDEKSDKILEIDTGKPHSNSKQKNDVHHSSKYCTPSDQNSNGFFTMASPSRDSTTAQLSARSSSSDEVQSLNPFKLNHEVDDSAFWTANNSPKCVSATSRPGSAKGRTFTPAKSECSQNYFSGYSGSRSFISGYSDYPNFMANTESFRAKVRSQSAPKQRPEFDNSSSAKRFSANGFGDTRSNTQRVSALHANFKSKAYPGSGRLDRLGMPIYSDSLSSSGLYIHNRY